MEGSCRNCGGDGWVRHPSRHVWVSIDYDVEFRHLGAEPWIARPGFCVCLRPFVSLRRSRLPARPASESLLAVLLPKSLRKLFPVHA